MRDKKEMKRRAMAQVATVQAILRRWDPMGLAPGEMAPADEYDSYAHHLVSIVVSGGSEVEVVRGLPGLGIPDAAADASAVEVATEIIAAVLGESSIRAEDCSFETERLSVAEWHMQSAGPLGSVLLARIVRDMLTASVTEQLAESWQGTYSEERAERWISDRDEEGTQLLAVSSETRAPVALILLHHEALRGSEAPELRIGYFVAESQWGRALRAN